MRAMTAEMRVSRHRLGQIPESQTWADHPLQFYEDAPPAKHWDRQNPIQLQGRQGMLEEKLKTSDNCFFMMGKDSKARGKKSKVMRENYQVPPHASFNNVDEENVAWVCKSTHSKGVAAGIDLYNPSTSRSCAGCRISR
jgi:hypothetical protein